MLKRYRRQPGHFIIFLLTVTLTLTQSAELVTSTIMSSSESVMSPGGQLRVNRRLHEMINKSEHFKQTGGDPGEGFKLSRDGRINQLAEEKLKPATTTARPAYDQIPRPTIYEDVFRTSSTII